MRDYALACAVMNELIGNPVAVMIRNWRKRRTLKAMDSAALASLNLTEDDRRWALGLPLDTDPFTALEDRAFRTERLALLQRKPAARTADITPLPVTKKAVAKTSRTRKAAQPRRAAAL